MTPETESLNIQALNIQAFGQFEELETTALELWKKDQVSALELGQALIQVREACFLQGHGKWYKWCRVQDLDENRVHYCVRLAEEAQICKPFGFPRHHLSKMQKQLHQVIRFLPETIVKEGSRHTGMLLAGALFEWLTCAFGLDKSHWNANHEVKKAATDFIDAFVRLFHLAVLNESVPVQEEQKPC